MSGLPFFYNCCAASQAPAEEAVVINAFAELERMRALSCHMAGELERKPQPASKL